MGCSTRAGVLHGGPGTGKTMIAKALARESGRHFVSGSMAEWQASGDGHLGNMLAAMKASFDEARACQPAIMFIDEMDSLGSRNSEKSSYHKQVINAFLEHVQGGRGRGDVVLVAATNDISGIDPAILRAGRFGDHVHVPDPERADTTEILDWYLKRLAGRMELESGVTAERLTLRCLGAPPARIRALVEEASNLAEEEDVPLSMRHFLMATRVVADHGVEKDSTSEDSAGTLRAKAVHEMGHAFALRMLKGDSVHIDLVTVVPNLMGHGAVVFRPVRGTEVRDVRYHVSHGIFAMSGRAANILDGGRDSMIFGAGTDIRMARDRAKFLVRNGIGVDSDSVFIDAKRDPKEFSRAVRAWMERFHICATGLLEPFMDDVISVSSALCEMGDMEEDEFMKHVGHLPLVAISDIGSTPGVVASRKAISVSASASKTSRAAVHGLVSGTSAHRAAIRSRRQVA